MAINIFIYVTLGTDVTVSLGLIKKNGMAVSKDLDHYRRAVFSPISAIILYWVFYLKGENDILIFFSPINSEIKLFLYFYFCKLFLWTLFSFSTWIVYLFLIDLLEFFIYSAYSAFVWHGHCNYFLWLCISLFTLWLFSLLASLPLFSTSSSSCIPWVWCLFLVVLDFLKCLMICEWFFVFVFPC